MQISTFNIPFCNREAEEEFNGFLRGHRVLQVDKAFTGNGWAFCVEWLEGKPSGGATADWRTKRIDYREVLDEETFARFTKLRERRKMIAHEDGVPPYMVMTDAQMAEAAKATELTREVLVAIVGFGDARYQKYGERLLGKEVFTHQNHQNEG